LGGAGSTNNNQTGGANRTIMTRDLGNSHDQEGPTSASVVYQLLVQKRSDQQRRLFCLGQS
jgi:hypothetical protein